jgi:hypothetical protein
MNSLNRRPSKNASYQILVSDWLISKKSSPLKTLGQLNRNLVGSIIGRFSFGQEVTEEKIL